MDSSDDNRRFVAGLGNPGRKYVGTRHNVGFEVLEVLRRRWGLDKAREKFDGLLWEAFPRRDEQDRKVVLLAPMTYMNRSGRAVRAMLDFYQAEPWQLLVVYDEMALPPGRLRIRPQGSPAGHNGLADILRACDTDEVPRLRVGIGAAPGVMDPKDYVLGKFRSEERDEMDVATERAADAVEDWVFGDIRTVMDQYNRKVE